MKYILAIDQSTQGTKAVLTDEAGRIVGRADRAHRQIVNEKGWVSHDLEEIYQNLIAVSRELIEREGVGKENIVAIGLSNQRETTAAWRRDGTPIADAVVWQCGRAADIVERLKGHAALAEEKTGLPLSPFFPAAKMAWLLENEINQKPKGAQGQSGFCLGTMDAYLIYRLTHGEVFCTDLSNASRTQLFNLHTLEWDEELCGLFGIPMEALPRVVDSNAWFGATDMEDYFDKPVPILGVLGDSHAALFAQGCHEKGMVKATYGTGSSIMMNIGEEYRKSSFGLATSLAWGMDGKVSYVLEGNINYTGAVMTWLKDDVKLIKEVSEAEPAIADSNPQDGTVLVPAFSGLSAPYWDSQARALIYGMSRTTGRNELVRAAVESIAFQITDVLKAMEADSGIPIQELKVDGGPTRNRYLMQFQADMARAAVCVPKAEEFSALGAAYMAGLKAGLYDRGTLFSGMEYQKYEASMPDAERSAKYGRWKHAVALCREAAGNP